jgi:thiopurine S-methyltransferase
MEPSFWHERWAQGQTGFHLAAPHPLLLKHAAVLGERSRVLVPLCGKAVDLVWLAERGHHVLGVELSELAVRAFFAEQKLSARESMRGPFKQFVAGPIEILCGDFFSLEATHLIDEHDRTVSALYDRAALVALPELMRARYAQQLMGLLPSGARGLLITLEYGTNASSGPPFSVMAREVRALYEPQVEVRELERSDILDSEPRFRDRGITALYEAAYALRTAP